MDALIGRVYMILELEKLNKTENQNDIRIIVRSNISHLIGEILVDDEIDQFGKKSNYYLK